MSGTTKISDKSWVSAGIFFAVCGVVVTLAYALMRREIAHSDERQIERFATFGEKFDGMRDDVSEIKATAAVTADRVAGIERAQYRLEVLAQDRWTGKMMSAFVAQWKELHPGGAVPDVLKIQRDYAPTNQ